MLRFRVELRQCPHRQVHKLLEEQSEQGPQPGDVVRRDADIDCVQRVPERPQVEVALSRCRVDARVEPEREF